MVSRAYSAEQAAMLDAHPERGVAFVDGRSCRRPIAEACVIGAKVTPTFAIVGDSHADTLTASLADMLAKRNIAAFIYTNPGCPFIVGVIQVGSSERCDHMTDHVLDALLQHRIKNIIINDRSTAYIAGTRFDNLEGGLEPGAAFPFAPLNFSGSDSARQKAVLGAMRTTLRRLLDEGITIYHVLPIPEVGWHVPRTLAKLSARHSLPITTSLNSISGTKWACSRPGQGTFGGTGIQAYFPP